MATIARHQEISKRFLEQAEEELEKGDLLQASEKAWGAFAHFVESVAKAEGWPSWSYRSININAKRLIDRTSDSNGNMGKLTTMNWLHANFYEDFYSEDPVAYGIKAARDLLADLEVAATRLPSREDSDK